ncbi:protein of unknown function [Acidithiobacillus ferrivorans]|uniref:Uncharacterized protein n=2 Tax=root TaxID=1 RepID=A0A060UKE0_9PROT|nr:conserved hypothetical protein [Acidithiobacillus ferrivorans]SMH66712.1 protein of unknown function [Acidithiobacillus ferrivorans]
MVQVFACFYRRKMHNVTLNPPALHYKESSFPMEICSQHMIQQSRHMRAHQSTGSWRAVAVLPCL